MLEKQPRSLTRQSPEFLAAAIQQLHRQAHPGQPHDAMLCRDEPCWSLAADRRTLKATRQREWRLARRRAWLAANGPCVDCGSWDDLEVDHVDPSTKVASGVFWTWAEARRLAELMIRASPLSTRELARQLGVAPNTVWEARTGKTWGHLQEDRTA